MKMTEIIQDLPGVELLADGILIYGVGDTIDDATIDHNKYLELLMQRLLKHNYREGVIGHSICLHQVRSTDNSLLCLRNTPNKLNSSPVQTLFSRRTRGSIPMIQKLLKPAVIEKVSEDIRRKRENNIANI
ncbi:hypothetical protein evm_002368 [Chilo suppressalis]|nr:hypothetical protein evm_002368 [Chilo suppressalis]